MLIRPEDVYPSQDFLKPETVKYIFRCIHSDQLELLPAPPIVAKINGTYVAVDGHNLLAVYHYMREPIEVHVAKNRDDGIDESIEGAKERNFNLKKKFALLLQARESAKQKGINTFADLISKYSTLFN